MIEARTCPLCEATCGLLLDVVDGSIHSVRGNPANRFSRGFLCAKGAALNQIEDDPDRLRRPLLRRGDELVPVSWDDAFDDVERRLRPIVETHGADAVGLYIGNANHASDSFFLPVLQNLIGTKYVYTSGTVDQIPRQLASSHLYGVGTSVPVPDIDHCSFLVVIGGNPMVSNGSLFTVPDFAGRVRAMQARGGALVVVDPRRTATAELADEHLAVRPGTDPMLLLGVLRALADMTIDLGVLRPHLAGAEEVEELAASVEMAEVERVTGIGETTIRRLAERLVTAGGAAVYGRIGTTTQRFGTVTSYLIDCVNILSGNLDRTGGAMFPMAAVGATNTIPYAGTPAPAPAYGAPDRSGRYRQILAGGFAEYPVVSLPGAALSPDDDRLRALIVIGANPARSAPDTTAMTAALGALDYRISIDRYVNETSAIADVIFPVPRLLTKSQYDVYFYQYAHRNFASYSPPLLAPSADEIPEWQIYVRLGAIAAGLGTDPPLEEIDAQIGRATIEQIAKNPASNVHGRDLDAIFAASARWQGPERLLDILLRTGPYGDGYGSQPGLTLEQLAAQPDGVDLGALRPRVPEVLRTRSKKIEMAAPELVDATTAMIEYFRTWSPPRLSLIGRRNLRSVNTWTHNIPRLVGGSNRCTFEVNPADAQRHAVTDGDLITVATSAGSITGVVEVTDRVPTGVISAPFGWGHDVAGTRTAAASGNPGFNLNQIIPMEIDEPSGTAVLNAIPVSVEPRPAAVSAVRSASVP